MFACSNLTAFEVYLNLTIGQYYQTNQTSINGLNYTYWNGTADGSGVNVNALKAVIILESTKYVTASFEKYNWTGTQWELILNTTLVSHSWSVGGNNPPIPGFEFVFIGIALLSLMGLYIWKKNQIKIN